MVQPPSAAFFSAVVLLRVDYSSLRMTFDGNVAFNNNVTADPDGNEVATNVIGGGLHCSNDDPAPQFGDSGGAPNIVHGRVTGQCVGLT